MAESKAETLVEVVGLKFGSIPADLASAIREADLGPLPTTTSWMSEFVAQKRFSP